MWLSRKVMAALVAVAGLALTLPAMAQAPQGNDQSFKQVKLTEAQIQGFLGAQKEMAALAQKQGGQPTDKPDPKVQADIEAIAKRHGFPSFVDFDDVAFNISIVMGGLRSHHLDQERDRRHHGRQNNPRERQEADARRAERGLEKYASVAVPGKRRDREEAPRRH